ncbi:MAG TPA: DDE-type integrase/transposase/recombinase [Gemmatimonadaceae bacterium]|nr:DDE-type integrase/transposase/recombinase [Gemmatimonadaceae bacterium]
MKRDEVATSVGCTTESLRRWYNEAKQKGLVVAVQKGANAVKPAAPIASAPASSAPHDPGAGLGEHETKAILDYKKKHPSMGPAQIRAQLKRFLGWRVSVKAIARALRKAGYAPVHRKGRPVGDEHPRRFEAPHRNALWQLDFTELRVGSERRWLLVIEDDFSRFVVGHVLVEGPTSEVVVAALREAIRLHGKCERVYTDRGAAFTAWRDVTSCEQFLDEQLIDHSLRKAHRPQGGGKIESVIGTVQRELWEVVHFDSVEEAEHALVKFFADYNHRRAHLGIGSLVPADRFYGRWPEVVAEMDAVSRRRQGALALQLDRRLFLEPPAAGERVVALQLIVVGDQAELHIGGRRVVLGKVEP